MRRIVIELTNRCNLSCQHCFTGRHGGKDDLPLKIIRKILAEAKTNGFDHLSFTGGDPTVHRHFMEIVRLTSEAGYDFSFVTNGWNFTAIYSDLLAYRDRLAVITFSLDGATEETHDRLRGKGSYRRVMQAMSVCVMEEIPFTINMVITTQSRHELELMVRTAAKLGSRGVRFGHLMPAPLTTSQDFDLSPWERKIVEAEIATLRQQSSMPVGLAPGYHTTDLFPCAPLRMEELNIDCHGNLTKCCHLSGHGDGVGSGDVIGDLDSAGFTETFRKLQDENEQFRRRKTERLSGGDFRDEDFFPCWYCSIYYKKVDWLKKIEDHSWADLIR